VKFTYKILVLPVIAALGFVVLGVIAWRGNEESRRLSTQIEEKFFADLDLSLRLQNMAVLTKQAFATAIHVDEELGLPEASEHATAFREKVGLASANPQLDRDELTAIADVFNQYYEYAVPAARALATKEFVDLTDEDLTAIGQMNAQYEALNTMLAGRTDRTQMDMDAAFAVSRDRQHRRERVSTVAMVVALSTLLLVSTGAVAAILQPLRTIMRGTESIAAGDLYQQIDYQSNDMLGRLADSFRKMQRSLIRDVNRGKRAETALRASQERLSFAFDAANDGLWDMDIADDELYLSPRYLSILGYSSTDAARSVPPVFELCRPAERDELLRIWSAHSEEGKPVDRELEVRRKDGQWRWIHVRGKIVEQDASGKPRRSIGTIADVTVYKEAEARLRADHSSGQDLVGVGTPSYQTQTLLSDLGRPVSALLSSVEVLPETVPSRDVLRAAHERTASVLDAASRLVELERRADETLSLEELVRLAAMLSTRNVRLDSASLSTAGLPSSIPLRFSPSAVARLRSALALSEAPWGPEVTVSYQEVEETDAVLSLTDGEHVAPLRLPLSVPRNS